MEWWQRHAKNRRFSCVTTPQLFGIVAKLIGNKKPVNHNICNLLWVAELRGTAMIALWNFCNKRIYWQRRHILII